MSRVGVIRQHSSDALDEDSTLNAVRRPSIPPLAIVALSLWGGCAGSYALGFYCDRAFLLPAIIVAFALAVLAVFALAWGVPSAISLLVIGFAIGCALGLSATLAYESKAGLAASSALQTWTFTASEDAKQGDYRATVRASARSQADGEQHTVSVTLPKGKGDIFYGDVFTATTSLSKPRETAAERFYLQGVDAVSSPGSIERVGNSHSIGGSLAGIRTTAVNLLDGEDDANALCQALVCGYREQLRGSDLYASCKALCHNRLSGSRNILKENMSPC